MHHTETLGMIDLLWAFVNYTDTHFRWLFLHTQFSYNLLQLQLPHESLSDYEQVLSQFLGVLHQNYH